MDIPKKDIEIRWTKGTGAGGQNKNKLETCCVITHIPTHITARADCRTRNQSKREAMKALERKIKADADADAAAAKKADRDRKVAGQERVRTYNKSRNEVIDHRSGLKRRFDDVVKRGKLQDFIDWDEG